MNGAPGTGEKIAGVSGGYVTVLVAESGRVFWGGVKEYRDLSIPPRKNARLRSR
jgi:hypothetical protein